MFPLSWAAAFVLGTLVGSFLNVCIYRLPREESVVDPPSHCPACDTRIRWYDNLPVLAWILLRGRCRDCHTPFSIRYPLIELVSGALAVLATWRFGVSPEAVLAFGFCCCMLVVVFTDYDAKIIPDEMVIAGVILGLLATQVHVSSWTRLFSGATVGFGVLWAIREIYYRLTGREGMGFGDCTLALAMGSVLGATGVMITFFLASLVGTLIGLAILSANKQSLRTELPFGVFLAPAATVVLFVGPDVLLKPLQLLRIGG